jgi:hypothetical protein
MRYVKLGDGNRRMLGDGLDEAGRRSGTRRLQNPRGRKRARVDIYKKQDSSEINQNPALQVKHLQIYENKYLPYPQEILLVVTFPFGIIDSYCPSAYT